jgi:predicted RNA binding protein YcfA (HicA-like mRNA interferase family)
MLRLDVTQIQKLLKRIRNNPKAVTFHDLTTLLESFGFELIRVSGSHHIFSSRVAGKEITLVIPLRKGHINSHYVKEVLASIDRIEKEIDWNGQ